MGQTYRSATAFRQALEDRLKRLSGGSDPFLVRLRREVAFEGLLARFFDGGASPWVLKGGYGIEVRFRSQARSTQDIDLGVPDIRKMEFQGNIDTTILFNRLREVAGRNRNDWFIYEIGAMTDDLEGAPYGGARFPVECTLDGRQFVNFHLDVGLGDPVYDPEVVPGHDLLSFADIPPARMVMYSLEQQFSEKVHAYCQPRGERTNSRTRDLVDIVLIIQSGKLDEAGAGRAIVRTFEKRGTPLPAIPPDPPGNWTERYKRLADEIDLKPNAVEEAFRAFEGYWKSIRKHMGGDK